MSILSIIFSSRNAVFISAKVLPVIFLTFFFISWRCNRTSETLVGRRPRSRSPLHGEPLLFSGSVSESLQLTESLVVPQLHVHHTKVVGESCPKVQQNTLARYHQKMRRPGTLIEFLHFLTNISTNCCSDFRLYQQDSCRPLISQNVISTICLFLAPAIRLPRY